MKSFSRIFFGLCATLFILSLALLVLAPTLVSSSWGTAAVSKFLSRKLHGEISIGSLGLSWLSDQKAEDIVLRNSQGEAILSIGRLEAESSLFSLLGDPLKAGTLRLIDLKGTIVQDRQGVTNIEDVLGIKNFSHIGLQTPVFIENVTLEARKDSDGKIVAKAVGLTRQNELKGQFSLNVNLADTQSIQLNAQNFPVLVLDQTVAIQKPELSGLFLNLLGDSLDINVDQTHVGTQKTVQLLAKSPFVKSSIKAELLENSLKFHPGSTIQFNLPVSQVEQLQKRWAPSGPLPLQPLAGQLIIDGLEYPLSPSTRDTFSGHVSVVINGNQFAFAGDKNPLNLNQLLLSIDAPATAPDIAMQLKGEGSQAGAPLSLELSMQFPKEFLVAADLERLLESGISLQGQYQGQLMDTTLAANWQGVLRNQNSQLQIALNTEKVSLPEVHLSLDTLPWSEILATGSCCSDLEGVIALKKPRLVGSFDQALASVEKIIMPWSVNPTGSHFNLDFKAERAESQEPIHGSIKINHWNHEEGINLSKANVQMHLKLHDFDLHSLHPFLPHQDLAAAVSGNVNAEIAAVREPQGHVQGSVHLTAVQSDQAFLKTLTTSFTSENDHRDISFQLQSKQAVGSTQLTGSLHNLFDENGKMRPHLATFSLKGQVKHFPVNLLVRTVTGNNQLAEKAEAILGSAVDADISADIRDKQGPLWLNVKGLNGQLALQGKVEKGVLLLTEPLTASLKITPQLDKAVLREFIPLLGYALSAEQPIELTIAKEGFSIPLRSPSLSNVTIGGASLNLNKILFSRDSQLGKVVALLGINANSFLVWFTPLYFSLDQGLLSIERTDMLISDSYPLASWGTVDFENEQLNLNIALSGAALKKAFSITGISNSFMLRIPLKGSIDHPQIDTGQVAARISSLVVQSRVPEGHLLGTIVDVATNALSGDQVPEPTTSPLPWESNTPVEEKTADEKPWDKVIEQPIKELKKGAKSILKNIFGK